MRYVIRPGDCVASLAATHGTSVDAIWEANDELRERRESPNMLCPGDVIELPEPTSRADRVEAAGSHRFSGTPPTVMLELLLVAEQWGDDTAHGRVVENEDRARIETAPTTDPPLPEALANAPYRLTVGGRVIEGTTDGDGRLSERVDARATRARLQVEPDTPRARSIDVLLGYLDPPEEPSGIRQRLHNLGYGFGGADSSWALEAFQKAHGLEVTGELDDETRERILDASEG